jgi:FAD/FMN-containing dehydrogenase
MVLRNRRNYPLAPLPDTDFCMMVALRPAMSLRDVAQYMPELHQIQARALEAGAKMYMMSIDPEIPGFLDVQFGSALAEFVSLKRELDPKGLLNPGLLC